MATAARHRSPPSSATPSTSLLLLLLACALLLVPAPGQARSLVLAAPAHARSLRTNASSDDQQALPTLLLSEALPERKSYAATEQTAAGILPDVVNTNASDAHAHRSLLGSCSDQDSRCPGWASQGYCASCWYLAGKSIHDVVCPKSCGACSSGGGGGGNSGDWRSQLLSLVNQARASAGARALCYNAKLNAASQAQSDSGAYGHTWNYIGQQGYKWSALGQNIAQGQTSVQQVFNAWFNESPPNDGHRLNILNPAYNQMGAGLNTGFNYLWTQNFGQSSTEPCS